MRGQHVRVLFLWGNYSCVVEVLWTLRVDVGLFPKLVFGHIVGRVYAWVGSHHGGEGKRRWPAWSTSCLSCHHQNRFVGIFGNKMRKREMRCLLNTKTPVGLWWDYRGRTSSLNYTLVDLGNTKTRNTEQIQNASVRDIVRLEHTKRRTRSLEIGTALGPVAPSRAQDRDPAGVAAARLAPPPGSPPAYFPRGARLANGDKADPTTSPRRGPRPGPGARRGGTDLRPPAGRALPQRGAASAGRWDLEGARLPARPALRAWVPGVSLPPPPPPRSSRTETGVPAQSPPPSRSHPPWLLPTWLRPPRPRASERREPPPETAATAPPARRPRPRHRHLGSGRKWRRAAPAARPPTRAVAKGRDPRLRRPPRRLQRRTSTPGLTHPEGPGPGPPWLRGVRPGSPTSVLAGTTTGLLTSRHAAVLTGTPRTPAARPGLATTSLPAPKAWDSAQSKVTRRTWRERKWLHQ